MRITADKFNEFKKDRAEIFGMGSEDFPVDLYGKRIFPDKSDSKNLANAAEDIKEYYGLDGDDGLS